MDINLIKLNSSSNKKPLYINTAYIGHFYEASETRTHGVLDKPKHTVVGVVTHNNGGFNVAETPEPIRKMLSQPRTKKTVK